MQTTTLSTTSFDCAMVTTIPQSECQALVAIYNNLDGVNWYYKGIPWLTTTNPCTWSYVTCEQQHVTHLQLEFAEAQRGIAGDLPGAIGLLTNLQSFSLESRLAALGVLFDNHVTLPVEMETLIHLQSLSVPRNNLATFPFALEKLVNLRELDLSGNPLTNLPANVDKLTNLQTLNLSSVKLTNFPSELVQLTHLQNLYLGGNELTSVPDDIDKLINLQAFSLFGNQLTDIPIALERLSKLTYLDIASNKLTMLSANIGQLTNLQYLNLSNNPLNGPLPQTLSQLNAMRGFYFEGAGLCVPTNSVFQSWLFSIPSRFPFATVPCLQMSTNFSVGAPGSQFTLSGKSLHASTVYSVAVNLASLGSIAVDANHHFTFTLSSAAATTGVYFVKLANERDAITLQLVIAMDAPVREATGTATFAIPPALAYTHSLYLPAIKRPLHSFAVTTKE
jgi:hypothetical protein